jgi:hypothetical protein
MRSPFNTKVDIYTGPGAFAPGSYVGTFPCRFVVEDGVFAVGPGAPPIEAYITIDAYMPRGMWETPFFGADPSLSDQAEVHSIPGVTYWVVLTDHIVWGGEPAYWRAYLAEVPVPVLDPHGLVEVLGAAAIVMMSGSAHAGLVEVSGATAIVRFSTQLWDTFTDSDGLSVAGHAPEIGGPWSILVSGSWQIQSNKLRCLSGFSGSGYNTVVAVNTAASDIDASVLINVGSYPVSAGFAGIVFRLTDNDNYLMVELDQSGNAVMAYRKQSGGYTLLATAAFTFTANTTYNLRVVATGSNVLGYVDGVLYLSFSTTFQQNAVIHGLTGNRGEGPPANPITYDSYRIQGFG